VRAAQWLRYRIRPDLPQHLRTLLKPSLIMLKRVVKLPLLATFTGVVTVGILTIGFTFNILTQWFI
jgi:hypothetical protein